jgi:hypothetical protein
MGAILRILLALRNGGMEGTGPDLHALFYAVKQLVLFALVFVGSPAIAAVDSTGDSAAIAPRSRTERENRLRPLLAQAGKPNGTFLLEARFPIKVALLGEPIDIILSVKNVGSDLTSFGWCVGETNADVWVKDEMVRVAHEVKAAML